MANPSAPPDPAMELGQSFQHQSGQLGQSVPGKNICRKHVSVSWKLDETQSEEQESSYQTVLSGYGPSAPPDPAIQSGQSVPGELVPKQFVPGQSVPGQSIPKQSVPGQNARRQSVPGQSVLKQSDPGQNVRRQSVPGESIQGQSVSGKTARWKLVSGSWKLVGMHETQSEEQESSYQNVLSGYEPSAPPDPAMRLGESVPGQSFRRQSVPGQSVSGESVRRQSVPGSWKLVGMHETQSEEQESSYQNVLSGYGVKKSLRNGNFLSNGRSTHRSEASDSDSRAVIESLIKALKRYITRLSSRADTLQRLIDELREVSASLDETHKGARIAGITGGATGAAGAAAFVGGILLAPATLGASLAVAAVGAGVAVAGGVTGASASITKTVKTNQVRKKVESILNEYQIEMNFIEVYLNEISKELEKMISVKGKSPKIVKLVKIATGTSAALSATNTSSGVIKGFAVGMDFFFTGKDSQKLKKESKTKFAQQINEVADQMETGLTELTDMRDKLVSEGL